MKENKGKKALLALVILVGVIWIIWGDGATSFKQGDGVKQREQMTIVEVRGRVLATDNEEVIQTGVANIGYQSLEVSLLNGAYKGETVKAINQLNGQADLDNFFEIGDHVLIALRLNDQEIVDAKAVDLMRLPWLSLLFVAFVVLLLLYAGFIGVKALLSFLLSVGILWEVFIKGLLEGKDPIILVMVTVILLSVVIIFLVAGLNKKGLSAFLGTISGLFITMGLTLLLGERMGLYGMTQPYVQQVIFSGYYDLKIQKIFFAAIVLGASGAAMDIAMDISASMAEIKEKKPDIGLKELIISGITIGRHVIGTMATTLLLAYSGGYVTLLMVFQIKEASFLRMMNLKIVSAEVMRTLIGSMGLVLVAPITAVVAGLIFSDHLSFKNRHVEAGTLLGNKKDPENLSGSVK